MRYNMIQHIYDVNTFWIDSWWVFDGFCNMFRVYVFTSLIFMASGLTLARRFSSTEMFGASRPVAIEFDFLMLFGHLLSGCFGHQMFSSQIIAATWDLRVTYIYGNLFRIYTSVRSSFCHTLINVQMLFIWYLIGIVFKTQSILIILISSFRGFPCLFWYPIAGFMMENPIYNWMIC